MRLKIFSDKIYLPGSANYFMTLYPLWGRIKENDGDPDKGRFDYYCNNAADIFEFVDSIQKCNIAILPAEWHFYKTDNDKLLAYKFSELCKKNNKKLIIFFNNDSSEDIPIDNSIILRTSFYRSTRKQNEFSIPGWSIDYNGKYCNGILPLRGKNILPSVGYCGYIDYDFTNIGEAFKYYIKKLIGKKAYQWEELRGNIIRKLINNKEIKLNFTLRRHTGAGKNELRKEYVQNMLDSDYLIATRGCGNFSYRLYEIMSLGRIPLFIDTDTVLPYDHLINYKEYFLWVNENDINSIDKKIVDFHNKMSNKDFEQLQFSIRKLYEDWISPYGFHKNLYRII